MSSQESSPLQKICQRGEYTDSFRYLIDHTGTTSAQIQSTIQSLKCSWSSACSLLSSTSSSSVRYSLSLKQVLFISKVGTPYLLSRQLPRTREPPYDILFVLSILSIFVSCTYICTLVYNGVHPVEGLETELPASFNSFCLVTGTVSFLARISSALYNFIFCLYYVFKIKNPLRSWGKEHKEVHVICMVGSVVATVVVFASEQIGVSALGVCGLKVSKVSFFVELSISLLYILVLVLSSVIFLNYVKKLAKLYDKARIFFKYFLIYTILITSNYLLQTLSLTVLTVECYQGLSQPVHSAMINLGNIFTLALSIMITLVLFFHPEFSRSLLPSLSITFSKTKRTLLQSQQNKEISMFQYSGKKDRRPPISSQPVDSSMPFCDDLLIEFSSAEESGQMEEGVQDNMRKDCSRRQGSPMEKDYLSDIKDTSKASLLSTILGYLSMEEGEHRLFSCLPVGAQIPDLISSMQMEEEGEAKNHGDEDEEQEQEQRQEDMKEADLRLQSIEMAQMGANTREEGMEVYTWNFNDRSETFITTGLAKDNSQYFTTIIPTMPMKIIAYCPTIFRNLRRLDRSHQRCETDLSRSMSAGQNIGKVQKNSQADGGRSGQFFYFTHDNKFILKTVTKNELAVFRERIEEYYNHLVSNEDSLIVKIYGVYTSINIETDESVNFIVMANLQEDIGKDCILRVYDLKGSTYKREVLSSIKIGHQPKYPGQDMQEAKKQKTAENTTKFNQISSGVEEHKERSSPSKSLIRTEKQTQIDRMKKTLKDIDFDKLENQIWLDEADRQRAKNILKSDSNFFASNGLIDYSLIVIMVDYQRYRQKSRSTGKQQQQEWRISNSRTMFPSCRSPQVVYILGIIDYLETWNMMKKGEKWYKSLFKKSESISSQSPEFYSERFHLNLVDKIFRGHEIVANGHKDKQE